MAAGAARPNIPDVFYEGWRATRLTGQSVKSFKGEELGEVSSKCGGKAIRMIINATELYARTPGTEPKPK